MSTETKQLTFAFAGLAAEHVNIILAGLNELPRKVSGELFDAIAASAQEQARIFQEQNPQPQEEEVEVASEVVEAAE